MSKVKLTREQKKALEIYKGYNENLETFIECKDSWSNTYQSLKELTLDEMARLLYQEDSYEIKEEFAVGDWVVYFNGKPYGNKANKIELIEDGYAYFDEYRRRSMPLESLRHATPEEIAAEKEKRWWAKHSRDVWELRKGDVIKRHTTCHVVHRSQKDNNGDMYIDFYEHGSIFTIKELRDLNSKVVCFAEDRKDE